MQSSSVNKDRLKLGLQLRRNSRGGRLIRFAADQPLEPAAQLPLQTLEAVLLVLVCLHQGQLKDGEEKEERMIS